MFLTVLRHEVALNVFLTVLRHDVALNVFLTVLRPEVVPVCLGLFET